MRNPKRNPREETPGPRQHRRTPPGEPPKKMHHPEVEAEVEQMHEAAEKPPEGPLEG